MYSDCSSIYTVSTLNKASELAGIQATILHGIYDDNKHKDGKFKFELGVSYKTITIIDHLVHGDLSLNLIFRICIPRFY